MWYTELIACGIQRVAVFIPSSATPGHAHTHTPSHRYIHSYLFDYYFDNAFVYLCILPL